MDKDEIKRIKMRALWLLDQHDSLKAKSTVLAHMLKGDAIDILNVLEYVERLEIRLAKSQHKFHEFRLLSEAELKVLLDRKAHKT